MAVYKLYPYKDATLYSFYPNANMGLDSILEVGNPLTIDGSSGVFRALLAFDQTEINSVINTKISNSLWQANLRCYIANAEGVDFSSTVFAYPVSGTWSNGTGQFGEIKGQALESSTVDLANELVRLMVLQRSYSANSQSMKAFDQTLRDTLQMVG
jgi:hypothetical protein